MDRADRAPGTPEERPVTVYLNDREWLTVQATPADLHDWAVGYLCGEGVIRSPAEIARLVADEDRGLVWVDASPAGEPPELAPLAAGPAGTAAVAFPYRFESGGEHAVDDAHELGVRMGIPGRERHLGPRPDAIGLGQGVEAHAAALPASASWGWNAPMGMPPAST